MANEHTESTQNLTFWIQKMTPDFGAIIIELREKAIFLLMNIVFWTFLKVFDIEQNSFENW